jgi:hypothetical protein
VTGVARGAKGEGQSSAHSEKYKYERARCIWGRKANDETKRREKRKEENKRKRVNRKVEDLLSDIRAIPFVLDRGMRGCMKFYSLTMLKSCLDINTLSFYKNIFLSIIACVHNIAVHI